MNKSKQPLNNKLSKKIQKEVHKARKTTLSPEVEAESDQLTAKEMLQKFPKKPLSKQKANLNSLKKIFTAKKKKSIKESKRTTPGLVPNDSTPAFPHKEGKAWIKTIVKQNISKRKSLNKKLSKKK